jgi:hypothetical protein
VSRPGTSSVRSTTPAVRTKTRIELRTSPGLRAQLDELAELKGVDASTLIRQLVAEAYSEAFGSGRGISTADPPEPRQGPVAARPVASEPDYANMTTDEILAAAGIDLGPDLDVEGE